MPKTKSEMYELYHQGLFGNRLKTWESLVEYRASGYSGNVTLRYRGESGGKWVAYNVEPSVVPYVGFCWCEEGADLNLITVNESAPDDFLTLQGEVMRSPEYLSLRCSRQKSPMRVALKEAPEHLSGIIAVTTLKNALDHDSYEDLMLLLDTYPDSIVEFSTWSIDVGNVPRRNTVFWEVRNY